MTVVLKDFWAEWCGPCRVQTPIVEELEEKYKNVKFEKINVDENPDEAGKYGVMSIPTIIIEKDGEVQKQFIGVTSHEDLVTALDQALG